jgi:hypothetical protein
VTEVTAGENTHSISIRAELAGSINYASHQNSVPVVKSLIVQNHGATTVRHLKLSFRVTPAFARGRICTLSELNPVQRSIFLTA